MKPKNLLSRLLLVLALLWSGQTLLAQGVTTSGINGKVLDDQGAELPGATVVAIHVPTGSKYGNITDASGFYRIPNMKAGGPYTVTISFVGQENFVREGIYLTLGQTFKLDATLASGATELQEVLVIAREGELFDGNRTGASTNIGVGQINNLPSASRNLTDFTRMTPQATVTGDNVISIVGTPARFNSFYIDGANNTDAFGLEASGTNGGGTGAPPISIDAIEQFTVDIAPYDVTLAGFTGGAISAVTRSGTNEFNGSAYYYWRNEAIAGKTPDEDDEELRERLPEFTARTYGMRLGGPIIKNKLFFFVNAELQRNTTPTASQFSSYTGSVTNAQLNALANRFRSFGYEPGTYDQNVNDELTSDRFLIKFDASLSDNHKLSARYSYNSIEVIDRNASSVSTINFSNNGESTVNTTHSTAIELNSTFGSEMANKLTLSYTNVLEDRDPINDGRLPAVDIEDGAANILIGPDPFSTGNILKQELYALTNNFTLFKGRHTITLGTHNEFFKFRNLFLGQNFGDYTYTNVDDFLNGAEPNGFTRSYSLATPGVLGDDIDSGAALFNAMQLGFYAQDEIQVNDKFKVTAGLRLDIPMLTDDPVAPFADFNSVTRPLLEAHHDLKGAEPGQAPGGQLLLSPRLGFNYDVKGDQTTQVRGGIGIFTGRTLFVWAGGAYTNSGGLIGRANGTTYADNSILPYITDLNDLPVSTDLAGGSAATIPSGRLEMFEDDFKWPQVLRFSGAVDQKLPWNMIGTFEFIYSYYTNNISIRNVNYNPNPIGYVSDINRPIYQAQNQLDSRFDEILVVGNQSGDNSYNLTWQLTKPFENGFFATMAYTFGRANERNISTSSQLSSMWRRNEVGDYGLNHLKLTRSDFDPGSRVMLNLSYKKEYADKFASTISLFWNSQQGQTFSYVINESNSGFPSRNLRREDVLQSSPHDGNLAYIPVNSDDIVLEEYTDFNSGNQVTPAQQWNMLNSLIESDDYLRKRRGRVADRNMARVPWSHTLDLKFTQDFYIDVAGKKNTLQFTLDIFNFTNMINKDWGKQQFVNFQTVNLLDFRGYVDEAAGDYTPIYRYTLGVSDVEDLYITDDSGTTSSRWQMQVGVRYIFGN